MIFLKEDETKVCENLFWRPSSRSVTSFQFPTGTCLKFQMRVRAITVRAHDAKKYIANSFQPMKRIHNRRVLSVIKLVKKIRLLFLCLSLSFGFSFCLRLGFCCAFGLSLRFRCSLCLSFCFSWCFSFCFTFCFNSTGSANFSSSCF